LLSSLKSEVLQQREGQRAWFTLHGEVVYDDSVFRTLAEVELLASFAELQFQESLVDFQASHVDSVFGDGEVEQYRCNVIVTTERDALENADIASSEIWRSDPGCYHEVTTMSGCECVENFLGGTEEADGSTARLGRIRSGWKKALATKPNEAKILRDLVATQDAIIVESWSRYRPGAEYGSDNTARKFVVAGYVVFITGENTWRLVMQ